MSQSLDETLPCNSDIWWPISEASIYRHAVCCKVSFFCSDVDHYTLGWSTLLWHIEVVHQSWGRLHHIITIKSICVNIMVIWRPMEIVCSSLICSTAMVAIHKEILILILKCLVTSNKVYACVICKGLVVI